MSELESRSHVVHGARIHYLECGSGDPIVFLHGNPTSSYLWRDVMPHLSKQGRCIAMDLIGMGKSDKPDLDHRFTDHYEYVEGFIESMGLKNVTLVIHDWGSALGFHYAATHAHNVKRIAFMEAMVKPSTWKEFPPEYRMMFHLLRAPFTGWLLSSVFNVFINKMLPEMVNRKLSDEEMQAYREPFPTIASRKPIRVWPQEIPIEGRPSDVHKIISEYCDFLKRSPIPKLMLTFEPGAIITNEYALWCMATLKNLERVHLGKGTHFVQEDHPEAIGEAISEWIQSHREKKAA